MVLQTERLHLRPVTLGDVPKFVANIVQDAAVWNALSGYLPDNPAVEIQQLIDSWQKQAHPPLAIERKADAAFLGYAALRPIEGAPDKTELTVALGSTYWGQGYATEAGRALLAHAFHTRKLPEVYGLVYPYEERGQRLAERLDMTFEGEKRDFRYGELLWVYRMHRATFVMYSPA